MELRLGNRVLLKNDFIQKIEKKEKSSKTFIVEAMTDLAVSLKNLRTGKSYTLTMQDVVNNLEQFEQENKSTGAAAQITVVDLPVVEPRPSVDPQTQPAPQPSLPFVFNAPKPDGGAKLTPTVNNPTVVKGDDPFGGLY